MSNLKIRLIGAAFLLFSFVALGRSDADNRNCPRKPFEGACIQVITFATNPYTGECCVYPNPCVVPDGWKTSFTGCP